MVSTNISCMHLLSKSLFIVIGLAQFLLAPLVAAPLELLSHRATYALELGHARPGAGVTALDGRLVLEYNNQCEGSTVTQRIVEQLVDSEGGRSLTDFSTSSWEASDGTSFRFSTRQVVDGEVQDQSDGSAELDAKGKPGAAIFTTPKGRRVKLPPGAIFPAEFNTLMIEAALKGDRHIDRLLFDGSSDVDLYRAIAFIGPEQPAGKVKAVAGTGGAIAAGLKSWIVAVGYFKPTDHEGLPEYEVTFRMFPNGLSGDLTIDYGDFSLKGHLIKVDKLAKSRC